MTSKCTNIAIVLQNKKFHIITFMLCDCTVYLLVFLLLFLYIIIIHLQISLALCLHPNVYSEHDAA